MKEFIALLAVANACFILGTLFGALVYHAILKVFKAGVASVESELQAIRNKAKAGELYMAEEAAKVKSVL